MHTAAKHVIERYKSGDKRLERRELQLVCREARMLLAERKNFHLDEYDVFEKAPRTYSMVRAMNIFNLSYFPEAAIAAAVINVYESLEEQGLFVVGSNGDAGSTVDGGIQELMDQVALGRGDFDTVRTGLAHAAGGAPELCHRLFDILDGHL